MSLTDGPSPAFSTWLVFSNLLILMMWWCDNLCLLIADISADILFPQASHNACRAFPSTLHSHPLNRSSKSHASLNTRFGGMPNHNLDNKIMHFSIIAYFMVSFTPQVILYLSLFIWVLRKTIFYHWNFNKHKSFTNFTIASKWKLPIFILATTPHLFSLRSTSDHCLMSPRKFPQPYISFMDSRDQIPDAWVCPISRWSFLSLSFYLPVSPTFLFILQKWKSSL